jgi:hypothetical protein
MAEGRDNIVLVAIDKSMVKVIAWITGFILCDMHLCTVFAGCLSYGYAYANGFCKARATEYLDNNHETCVRAAEQVLVKRNGIASCTMTLIPTCVRSMKNTKKLTLYPTILYEKVICALANEE